MLVPSKCKWRQEFVLFLGDPGRRGAEAGHLEDAVHRQEGQRHLKGKLVIRKGMKQTTGRLKKPSLVLSQVCFAG